MNFIDDDDDLEYEPQYADGHWEWDNNTNELKFTSTVTREPSTVLQATNIVDSFEFKEDLDILEQQRFKRRFQRKAEENDVVTLQDVKDLVLYTAPANLLSSRVVHVLHSPTTERFLRALILYCQYYAQMAEITTQRKLDLETKIPNTNSINFLKEYEENLLDLRLLVAKEYCTMLIGGADFRKFHHMGKHKKMVSMTRKEAILFESLIRLSIQIVWIALARRKFTQIDRTDYVHNMQQPNASASSLPSSVQFHTLQRILRNILAAYGSELEVNRLFRSKKFNLVEHRLGYDAEANMSPEERQVLWGQCLDPAYYMRIHSPLFNEVKCWRDVNFRLLGLGVMKYDNLNERLHYLENCLTANESDFPALNISLGIIGLKRSRFDIMLREILIPPTERKITTQFGDSNMSITLAQRSSKTSRMSNTSVKSSNSANKNNLYQKITLPPKTKEPEPQTFPSASRPRRRIDPVQYQKWLDRVTKMAKRRGF